MWTPLQIINESSLELWSTHRRRNRQKRRQRSSLLFSSKEELKNSYWMDIHFGRVVVLVWCELDDHPLFWSIHSAKRPLFNWSFSSNDPGAKSFVQHNFWMNSIPQTAATTFAFSSIYLFCIDTADTMFLYLLVSFWCRHYNLLKPSFDFCRCCRTAGFQVWGDSCCVLLTPPLLLLASTVLVVLSSSASINLVLIQPPASKPRSTAW